MKPYAALVLSLGVAVAPSMLQAQDAWPARPITFLVPYGAGGYTDLVARLTGRYVERRSVGPSSWTPVRAPAASWGRKRS